MLQKVFQILHQELLLYQSAVETEKEKRRAILSADGSRMQEFTKKSETFMREADALEESREKAFSALMAQSGEAFNGNRPQLGELLELGARSEEIDRSIFDQVRDHFAPTVRQLKTETDENRRLLENSGRSLHRALTDLQNRADPRDETYRPDGSRSNQSNASVLLNANA